MVASAASAAAAAAVAAAAVAAAAVDAAPFADPLALADLAANAVAPVPHAAVPAVSSATHVLAIRCTPRVHLHLSHAVHDSASADARIPDCCSTLLHRDGALDCRERARS